jgi:small GTP-binding protein
MAVLDVKIVLLGEAGVGKTSIIQSFLNEPWRAGERPTIAAHFQQRSIYVDQQPVNLRIWDTAGQERFRSLAPMYYRDAEVAVLVFAVDERVSFDGLQEWLAELNAVASAPPRVIIAGNKTDVDGRVVPATDAEKFADDNGAAYIETSAKAKIGIDELFLLAAQTACAERRAAQAHPVSTRVDVAAKPGRRKRGCCK